MEIKIPYTKDITYFECSEITVDREGLKILSLSASMKLLGPDLQQKDYGFRRLAKTEELQVYRTALED